jgi:NIMA (never in mitosis gene a)-related kinase
MVKYFDSQVEGDYLYILMEHCEGGDLQKLIKKHKKEGTKVSEIDIWRYTKETLEGLKYLHDQKVLHRDIKPQNLLLDDQNSLKICDLGISKSISSKGSLHVSKTCTPLYVAPEILKK